MSMSIDSSFVHLENDDDHDDDADDDLGVDDDMDEDNDDLRPVHCIESELRSIPSLSRASNCALGASSWAAHLVPIIE
eukprot:2115492-Amphidinium_carterae.3